MKYLCLCYYDLSAFSKLSPEEAQEIGPACRPHDAALRATGKLIAQGSLSAPETWVHFVPQAGVPTRAEGPYLSDNRQAGAFFIVDAETAQEAEGVASKHAAANFGEHLGFAVEVRPCDVFESYRVAA